MLAVQIEQLIELTAREIINIMTVRDGDGRERRVADNCVNYEPRQ